MGYPAIKRRRLYEDVASSLEQMIRDADFLPGDQLPSERELMVRFGVGRPAPEQDTTEHVLEAFSAEEQAALPAHIDRAARAVAAALRSGVYAAMNEFNRDPDA